MSAQPSKLETKTKHMTALRQSGIRVSCWGIGNRPVPTLGSLFGKEPTLRGFSSAGDATQRGGTTGKRAAGGQHITQTNSQRHNMSKRRGKEETLERHGWGDRQATRALEEERGPAASSSADAGRPFAEGGRVAAMVLLWFVLLADNDR
jgi:hypothetical protein